MPAGKKRIRETKPKTKTFTGCWTCRGRKVKCDATRPTCSRCKKAGLCCDGYDLKLYWVTDEDTVAPSAIKRQAMTLEGSPAWALHPDEVDRLIADLDGGEGEKWRPLPVSHGPFNVFSARASKPAGSESSLAHEATTNERNTVASVPASPATEMSFPLDCRESSPSIVARSSSETSDITLLVSIPGREASPSCYEIHPALFQDALVHRLMENYVGTVAIVLPPLPHPENAYAAIYVPKAMAGASKFLFGLNCAASETPSSSVAVFYAVLATSAFHLRGSDVRGGSELDLVARGFRAKAFASLQKALREPLNANGEYTQALLDPTTPASLNCEAVISAMLTLITTDVMEGSMSEYWIHLAGVDRLARQLRNATQASPGIDRLITISSFLSTLASTTALDLPPKPWADDQPDVSELEYDACGMSRGLESAYGITPVLAHLMHRIVGLSRNISYYVSNSTSFPPALISACASLSDALSRWSIDSEPLAPLFSASETDFTLQLAKHHILAFAHALRVYYHTRISPCTPAEMATYVDRVAEHLIEMEEIKSRAGYDSNISATLSWPGFIAACEAAPGRDRDVWHRWWTEMLKYRIGNIAQLWKVVQEAWSLRDNEGLTEVPAWLPVLRRSGKRVLAV